MRKQYKGWLKAGKDKEEKNWSHEKLTRRVDEEIKGILRSNLYESTLKEKDYTKVRKNKEVLRQSLRLCGTGDDGAKEYVKLTIQGILLEKLSFTNEEIHSLIPFHRMEDVEIRDKFYLLLKEYGKRYEKNAFSRLVEENRLLEKKESFYVITQKEVEQVFLALSCRLSFPEKLEFLTQKVYERSYGLGVVDELCSQKIDGISAGTSEGGEREASVWIQWQGKNLYLPFLEIGSARELERICKRIYRFGHVGQLTASKGYIVNELADQSRVVVTRPPFSESWSFFVRRFDTIETKSLSCLIGDENAALPVKLLIWLVKSQITMGITGAQGSGKTTLLTALVEHIPKSCTLRIQEMNYELHLRKRYPDRNIVTFRETETISSQEGLDLQKKTDGAVNILGEVATHEAGSYLIQMGMVASLFTLFTHHAVTTENLVMALRNNLLALGHFHKEEIAQAQVIEVVGMDVHLEKALDGHRYLARITQIIPEGETGDYSCQDLVRFEKGRYIFVNPMAERFLKRMESQLPKKEWEEWNGWYGKIITDSKGSQGRNETVVSGG